jgi:aminoglycoside 6'-N-acetyltransferase
VTALYEIRQAVAADLDRLTGWRAQPHVSRWWGDPSIEPEAEKLGDARVAMWIVTLSERPFAFIQDYAVSDWSPHHFDHLPRGSRGMDLYIGEADMLGAGHGPAFVRQHVDALFARGVPAIGIDPHPDNAAAIGAFEKAGFAIAGAPLDTRWGRAVLMARYAPR